MNKKVLSFVNKLEGYKTAIKELHWDADNMSQHELCDKIADSIAEFQDTVSEVEQSITGKLATGNLKPVSYKVTTLKKFVEDVLDATNTFYKSLEDEGDTYTGMRSDCESFLSDMQRNLYLVNFTMKEDLKRRIANRINEAYRKEENIKTTFHGTKPSTEKGLFKRINDLTKNGQLNTRLFGGVSDALDFYRRILGKIGNLRCVDACEGNNYVVKLDTEGGLSYLGLMRIKDAEEGKCKASITFSPHADVNDGVEPEESEPTIEDDFDYEDTPNEYGTVQDDRNYEIYGEGRITRMTGSELHNLIKESVKRLIKESGMYGLYKNFAFKNAKDLKDFDRLKQSAEIEGEDEAELAQDNHPQTNNNFYSHEYANGNLGLDDLENDAKWSKELYGL